MDIKATRKALGLTQIELGAKLGVDNSVISKMESGAMPVSLRTQLALEALLTRAGKEAA